MKKYQVVVTDIFQKIIEVEADSINAARNQVYDMCSSNNDLINTEYISTTINVINKNEEKGISVSTLH